MEPELLHVLPQTHLTMAVTVISGVFLLLYENLFRLLASDLKYLQVRRT